MKRCLAVFFLSGLFWSLALGNELIPHDDWLSATALIAGRFAYSETDEEVLQAYQKLVADGDCFLGVAAFFNAKGSRAEKMIGPLGDALVKLSDTAVLICETKAGAKLEKPGCVTVVRNRDRQWVVIGGTKLWQTVMSENLLMQYADKNFSGRYLVIEKELDGKSAHPSVPAKLNVSRIQDATRDDEAKRPKGPIPPLKGVSIVIPSEINVGRIPKNGSLIHTLLTIRNEGEKEVAVSNFKGSCRCFVKAEGPAIVPGRSEVAYKLVYDTSRIVSDARFESYVAFETSDVKLPIVSIKMTGEFDYEGYIFSDPQKIELGKLSRNDKNQGTQTIKVRLYTASDVRPGKAPVVLQATSSTVEIEIEKSTASDRHNMGRFNNFETYVLTIKPKAKAGARKEVVSFSTDNKDFPIIPISILYMSDD